MDFSVYEKSDPRYNALDTDIRASGWGMYMKEAIVRWYLELYMTLGMHRNSFSTSDAEIMRKVDHSLKCPLSGSDETLMGDAKLWELNSLHAAKYEEDNNTSIN